MQVTVGASTEAVGKMKERGSAIPAPFQHQSPSLLEPEALQRLSSIRK